MALYEPCAGYQLERLSVAECMSTSESGLKMKRGHTTHGAIVLAPAYVPCSHQG